MSKICYKCRKNVLDKDNKYGLHHDCFMEWFNLDQVEEFRDIVSKTTIDISGTKFSKINSSFFQGKFRKYSAELGQYSYILKVQEKDFPELPAVEYTCNKIGTKLGIKIPEFFIVDFEGLPTFVSKNFIKREKKENLIHIYRLLKSDDKFDCANLVKIIKEQTGKMSEVVRFIELCIFDSLIGNHDRHGRNIGFIEKSGIKLLSPFYDNVSYIGIEEPALLLADHSPRGKISTHLSDEPTIKDYVEEFKRLKYEHAIRFFKSKIEAGNILGIIDEGFFSKKRRDAFKRIVEKRFKELNDAI